LSNFISSPKVQQNELPGNLNGALCCVGEKRLVVVGKGFLRKGTEGWDDIYD